MRRVYLQRLLSTELGIFVKDVLRAFVPFHLSLTTSQTTTVFVIVDALEDSS